METTTYPVRMRERGQLTIPQKVRDKLNTDDLTLVQLDDFIFLTPKNPQVPDIVKRFTKIMDEENVSLADLLQGLDEERKASGNE